MRRLPLLLLSGVLMAGLSVPRPGSADGVVGNIAVIEADPTILQPGELFDLDGRTLTFTPRAGGGYTVSVGDLGFDTDLGSNAGLGDDASVFQPLSFAFPFFGVNYDHVFINSNGHLTFTSGSTLFHFNSGGDVTSLGTDLSAILDRIAEGLPRIAVLWQDWDPSAGGAVSANPLPDRLVVTWSEVPLFQTATTATFQVVLFATGVIQMSYQTVGTTPGGGYLTGISPGSQSPFLVTTINLSQAPASSISAAPDSEPLAQVFGTAGAPLVHVSAVARHLRAIQADQFDQLVMFTNFPQAMGGAFAFELTTRQTVAGIGLDLFDASSFFGSEGRLQSVLNMNRLDAYPDDPAVSFLGTNSTLDVMGQEAGHQWLAFVRFDDGGVCSDLLLGRGLAHWSFFHDTDASDMEGNRWQDNGNGTFTSVEATARFSRLDQYVMGLREASEVPSFFFVDGPSGTTKSRGSAPAIGVTVTGARENVTAPQVIACEGARAPGAGFSAVNPSATWRQAFVLLIQSGTTAPPADFTKLDTIRAAWVSYFDAATGGRGTVDTALGGDAPDLVTTGLSDPPATATPGTSFPVTDTARNQGTAAAGPSTTRYYLSLDTVKGGQDTLLTGSRAVPALAPGEEAPGTVAVVVPSNTAPGTYFLLACADDLDEVFEVSQGNNCLASTATVQVGMPDLAETEVSNPPAVALLGEGFPVTDTARNQGTVAAGASTTRYYLSLDGVRNSGDKLLSGSRAVPGLGAGEESTGTVTVKIPASASLGSYRLLACADDKKAVKESSEQNNCLASETTVAVRAPDLTMAALSNPPPAAATRSSFVVTDTVRNEGDAPAGPSTTRYYLSLDGVRNTGDKRLTGSRAVPSLGPGEESTGTVTITIPSTTVPGTYYLLACADDKKQAPESNEKNNCRAAAGQVTVSL